MREQGGDAAGSLRRQPAQHILEVSSAKYKTQDFVYLGAVGGRNPPRARLLDALTQIALVLVELARPRFARAVAPCRLVSQISTYCIA
jgi:hypothetical protein